MQGCKLRMDEDGNILVKRISTNSNVYVKAVDDENSISADVLRLPSQALELGRPIKVRFNLLFLFFCIKKLFHLKVYVLSVANSLSENIVACLKLLVFFSL